MSRALLTSLGSLALGVSVHAALVTTPDAPSIVVGPDGSQCIQLSISDLQGETAWVNLGFDPIDLTATSYLEVSFEIYRPWDGWAENTYWGVSGDLTPDGGAQWDNPYGEAQTYPFGWWDDPWKNQFANTVFDQSTELTLAWVFEDEMVFSVYAGGMVHVEFPLGSGAATEVSGFWFDVRHDSDTGHGGEVVYLDNLYISSDLGELFIDFDDYVPGPIDGQDTWTAGLSGISVIPEPTATAILLGGCVLVGVLRRRRL